MRLTLRTMLAYIDGILEPEDAEEIGKKIEDSEFAANLLHRTRDVMRRLRLAAPALTDRGPGLDANTVAEYLDNTLHDDRVPDFEKVCLDSDVHLAEVASCHQILTLVLGEAADIDPAARQRMYQLPELAAADVGAPSIPATGEAVTGEAAGGKSQSDGQAAAAKSRHRPVVPDYLRDPPKKRRLLPFAAALAVSVCLAGAILASLGYLDRDSRLISMLFGRPDAQQEGQTEGGESSPQQVAPGLKSPEGPTVDPAGPPPDPAVVDPSPPEPSNLVPPEPGNPVLPEPGSPLPPEPGNALPPDPGSPLPPEPGDPVLPAPIPPEGPEPPATPPSDPPPEPPPVTPPDPSPEPSTEPRRMGGLMSDRQVLLRYNPESETWQRVPSQGILFSNEALVALSGFRPRITLSAGVTLQLVGGTRIELLPGGDQEIAGLRIFRGQVVVMPLAEAGTRLRLVVEDHTGVITFTDAESVAAVEVGRVRAAGTDPQTVGAVVTTRLHASTGQIRWDSGTEHAPVLVEAGTCLTVAPQPAEGPLALSEFPLWIAPKPLGDTDRRATSEVEKALSFDRAAGLLLTELADPDYRREEVRRLAARCLGDIGQFDSVVAALNAHDGWFDWPKYYVEYLQEGLSRGPEEAAAIRQAIERQYREDPGALYRMLWGYSAGDLEGGEDAKLVEHLDSRVLAFRVLGFWNLQKITGFGLYYLPEQTEAKRQGPLRSWRKRLEEGEIRIKPRDRPSEPLSETADEPVGGNVPPPEAVPNSL